MDEETKQEIVQLRRHGATYSEIENLVGYGIKTIQTVMGEKAPELARMPVPRVPMEKRRAIARDYYANGLTAQECMEKHGIGARAMNVVRLQFRDEYGGKKAAGRRQNFTADLVELVRAEYDGGTSVRSLYEKYGITRTDLRKFGITKSDTIDR